MMRFRSHPEFVALSRLADGEMEPREAARVNSHVGQCESCAATLEFIHELGETARALPVPGPSRDAFERILARRSAGDRVILPVSGPVDLGRPRSRRLRAAVTVAVPLLGLTIAALILVPRATADRSELSFQTDRPAAGQELGVEYRSTRLFEAESRLILRARYRFAGGTEQVIRVGEMSREDDDVFRTRIVLPDSLVYAAFAVEDPAASIVDTNGRRLWELMIREPGQANPSFEALRERTHDLVGRNWEMALQTTRRMTDLYPDEPESWFFRYSFEATLVTGEEAARLSEEHRARYARLEGALRVGDVSPDRVAGLVLYGYSLGGMPGQEAWEDLLLRTAPTHPTAVQVATMRLTRADEAGSASPQARLSGLEELWRTAGPSRVIASSAFRTALQRGIPDVVLLWADRYATLDPTQAALIATMLADRADLRAEGIDRLRTMLLTIEAGSGTRSLLDNQAFHQQSVERQAQRVLLSLGRALVEEGRPTEGLDTLRVAAERAWNPDVFRAAADQFLAHGDTAVALPLLARAYADPTVSPATRDSIARIGEDRYGSRGWQTRVATARAEMRTRLLADAMRRRIAPEVPLQDGAGRQVPLREILAGETTVVAFWSLAGPAAGELPRLDALARDLQAGGARLVTIASEDASHELTAILGRGGYTFPVFHDPTGAAARAFGQWGTPEYFVIDGEGFIRFEYSRAGDVLRQAIVLHPIPQAIAED